MGQIIRKREKIENGVNFIEGDIVVKKGEIHKLVYLLVWNSDMKMFECEVKLDDKFIYGDLFDSLWDARDDYKRVVREDF